MTRYPERLNAVDHLLILVPGPHLTLMVAALIILTFVHPLRAPLFGFLPHIVFVFRLSPSVAAVELRLQ